jgi:hypothetical protein
VGNRIEGLNCGTPANEILSEPVKPKANLNEQLRIAAGIAHAMLRQESPANSIFNA